VFKLFPALLKLKKRVGGFLSGGEQQMLAIAVHSWRNRDFFFWTSRCLG